MKTKSNRLVLSKKSVINSRKNIRKQQRKDKKSRKNAYYTTRHPTHENAPKPTKKSTTITRPLVNTTEGLRQQELRKKKILEREMRKQRKEQLLEANIEEDRTIKRLEKQLKFITKKGKDRKVPKSFTADGLDYLLEVCESDNFKSTLSVEEQFEKANEDLHLMTETEMRTKHIPVEDTETNSSESDDQETSNIAQESKTEPWQDIYGRLHDCSGAIINNVTEDKYVPPALRKDFTKSAQELRLTRQLKGQLNRLTESNMYTILKEIENLYTQNSRNSMNETLTNLILEALVCKVKRPHLLHMEYVMLIMGLHANIGTEIGAYFLHTVIKAFNVNHKIHVDVEDKTVDNLICIIIHLYNFKLITSRLIYDILTELCVHFNEKDIECVLDILRTVGFQLRRDNPLELKHLIIKLQGKASNIEENESNIDARKKFLLEILMAIKNNNTRKIPNYDCTDSDRLKKHLKTLIRKGNTISEFNIGLEDLLQADEKGRWWIVGSAWSGGGPTVPNPQPTIVTNHDSDRLIKLAKKQRINTETRRVIFCTIIGADDYLDAFEKLLKLGLRNQQERDIIHVILHCCLQEKTYNPYYTVLALKFCEYDRKYQLCTKYAIWDKLKTLGQHSGPQLANLAKLLTYLLVEKGLPLSVLKIIQFSDLDKVTLRFMRQILIGILLYKDVSIVKEVFEKISNSTKLKMFRESLRLFIQHFMVKNLSSINDEEKYSNDNMELIKNRIDIVDDILTK